MTFDDAGLNCSIFKFFFGIFVKGRKHTVRVPHGWRMGSPNGIGCLHFFLHEYEEYHNMQCLCIE